MVLTHREERNVTQDHRVLMVLLKYSINGLFWVHPNTGKQLLIHTSDSLRSVSQAFTTKVFPDSFQDVADRPFDALLLYDMSSSVHNVVENATSSTASMLGSTSMVWALTLLIARSGSLRPDPVMTHTTRCPLKFKPWRTIFIKPATEAADAGSPNTPSWEAMSR